MIGSINDSMVAEFCSSNLVDVDFRNLSNPDVAKKWLYSSTDIFIITVIIPIVSLIGVAANGSFLYMCLRVEEVRDSSVTVYLFNLAVCDILFLIFTTILYTVILQPAKTKTLAYWPANSSVGCSALTVSIYTWYFASLGFITLISVERYCAICKPFSRINAIERRRIIKLIIGVWIFGFLLCLTLAPQYAHFQYYCIIWPDTPEFYDLPTLINDCEPVSKISIIWGSLLSIVSLMLTMIVNCFMYVAIIISLSKRPTSSTTSRAERTRYQVTRTLVANGIIFFICQVPYRIWSLDDFMDRVFEDVDLLDSLPKETLVITIGRAFVLINSIINPFLYVFSCEHYRKSMVQAFCGNRGASNLSTINNVGESGRQDSVNTVSTQGVSLDNLQTTCAINNDTISTHRVSLDNLHTTDAMNNDTK